jgi:carbon monoxide dehydrogenase subunit G
MDMTGEYRIAAPREKVWVALNDAEVLKQAIPGCDEIEKTSDTSFTAKVTAKVGPVKASFSGKVTLSDIDPPNGYTITGEGSGGVAGFAKGGAKVRLADEAGATLLTYTVEAQVGGKLAQIGSRLIDGTARKMAEDFFGRFAALVAEGEPVAEPVPSAEIAAAPEVEAAIAAAAEPMAAPLTATPAPSPMPTSTPAGPATLGTPGGAPPRSTADTSSRGLSPYIWIPILVVILGALVWYFR